uniref:NADH dehydrogenase subunit 6 n=1 Tax=Allacta hainanensis TaxID=3037030 RepID=UPI0027AA59E4|nr:NADH dehydrogenase subunit 6 [Allacta hainanensis]WGO56999.1 NADH dehydrogenase subunit 6 [Allacta hainanensis]
MKMMLSSMMMLSIIFMSISHPMVMGLILLLQTIMVSMMTGTLSQTFWLSYILFLIFLGGMLILFIYVTSITSNKMFYISNKMIIITVLITMMMFMSKDIYLETNNQESLNFLLINNSTTNKMLKLYNKSTHFITMMLASYLFLSLIVIAKITNIFKGPLRKM